MANPAEKYDYLLRNKIIVEIYHGVHVLIT